MSGSTKEKRKFGPKMPRKDKCPHAFLVALIARYKRVHFKEIHHQQPTQVKRAGREISELESRHFFLEEKER